MRLTLPRRRRLFVKRTPFRRRSAQYRVGSVSCALFAAICWRGYAPPAGAYQPLITDDTSTQGTGGNQVEVAINRQEYKSGGITTTTKSFPLTYTRGVTDALDLYGSLSHGRIDSDDPSAEARGHGNPVLGLKWRFYDDKAQKLSIALKPELQIGSSASDESRGVSIGRSGYSGLLILTQETSFGAVHANYAFTRVNYALESNRAQDRRNLQRLSAVPVYDFAPEWAIAMDAGVTTNSKRSERSVMGYAEVGLIWSPNKDLDLALGWIAYGRDGEPRASTLTAGVTWRFR